MDMKKNRLLPLLSSALFFVMSFAPLAAQKIYQYESPEVKLLFFDKNLSQYIPHIVREHSLGLARHDRLWNGPLTDSAGAYRFRPQQAFMYITDWNDDGNGGVNAIPNNLILIGMAPLSNPLDMSPSVERYRHLFSHELTHIYMTDKSTQADRRWRAFFGAKVPIDPQQPLTALWSYVTAPRWYNPRWFQEGIACFLETAMNGGVGRALGTYDEMYFRTCVQSGQGTWSAVGLETEGTSADFQVGATSYLYGTRFVNYLAYRYGTDSLFSFYNRTEGSRRHFSSQFKQVYGAPLTQVWNNWRSFEDRHQTENLATLAAYPLTELSPLHARALGSVSTPLYDRSRHRLYLAANYGRHFAHVGYIDLRTGKEHILRKVDGPALYTTTFVTLDTLRRRLIYNTHNSNIRGIEVIDADTGRRLKHLRLQRVSGLLYDNTGDRLYGIMSHAGVNHLVRYDADLENREILYTFPFGQGVAHLDISHGGDQLIATLTKPNGNQALIRFRIRDLEEAHFVYDVIKEIDNTSLIHFRFMPGDSTLIGSTNYTGVQNLWQLNVHSGEMDLCSNVETGLFCPVPYKDSLIALRYEAEGLRPVKLALQSVQDAHAVTLLGQKVFDRNPSLIDLSQVHPATQGEAFAEVYQQIKPFRPLHEMRFSGAYPELTGFRDTQAFNQVSPVVGYRFHFQDPIGLSRLSLSLGLSPWSHNPWSQRFHASLLWHYWSWTLKASWNNSTFYDLVGPLRNSRAGWNVGLQYQRNYQFFIPFRWMWSVAANAYGKMDALPLFQNIQSPVTSMQTLSAHIEADKKRTSLGGITPEQGWSLSADAYAYFADPDGRYTAFPSFTLQGAKGFLLPVGRHNSFWLHAAAGQSLGDRHSVLGQQFFGGFRNNYVDNGTILRYREVNAMPGAPIDALAARSFAKFTGELLLTPLRFRNVGFPGFYPSHAFFSLFTSHLLANPWGGGTWNNYVNAGIQLNVELALFSYMKTTWSVGYARMLTAGGRKGGELMLSLKLL